MQPEDRESLFWSLSELGDRAPRSDAVAGDELLVAYRRGELPEDEARRVEAILMGNPAARRRLAALAGHAPATAPGSLRRRLLDALPGSGLPASGRRSRVRPGKPNPWWIGLAAAAVLVLAIGTLLRPGAAPPAYEVGIDALAKRRGAGEGPGVAAEAFAGTTVTITATVAEQAVAGVEVALYRAARGRAERGGLERIPGDRLGRRERPGAVLFEAPAAALVGRLPGDYEIFVVVGWEGKLPAVVAHAPGDDPASALAAGGRRGVHRLTLRLLAERSADP